MYITPEQLNAVYPDETSDLTSEAIELAIEAGEGEVNGLLSRQYTVPFSVPLPPLLLSIVIDVVRYRLYAQGRPYNEELNKDVYFRYANAIEKLKKMVSGELSLSGDDVTVRTFEAVMIAPNVPRGWSKL